MSFFKKLISGAGKVLGSAIGLGGSSKINAQPLVQANNEVVQQLAQLQAAQSANLAQMQAQNDAKTNQMLKYIGLGGAALLGVLLITRR